MERKLLAQLTIRVVKNIKCPACEVMSSALLGIPMQGLEDSPSGTLQCDVGGQLAQMRETLNSTCLCSLRTETVSYSSLYPSSI